MTFSLSGQRIWVAGHKGMVGSAIVRALEARGDVHVLTVGRDVADLREAASVERWITDSSPDVVVLAAARVGGILANSQFPVDFLHDNLMIEANVMRAAHLGGVDRLLFLGSSCIYPKFATQPIVEESLLTGPLEPTNEWYAIAKIAGIKLCQAYRQQYGHAYISAMPTNLYGPGDNFDLQASHVLPALIRKMQDAKAGGHPTVSIWGTGTPRREFMHVDDLASACLFLLENYDDPAPINVGSGSDLEIRELARMAARVVGFEGSFEFDRSKPDGTPRKLMDGSKLRRLGWEPSISLESGLASTYAWFVENQLNSRLSV